MSLARFASFAIQSGWYFDPSGTGAASPTLALAFAAGVLSFLSPCVLPLVPGYISMLSGESIEELKAGAGPGR